MVSMVFWISPLFNIKWFLTIIMATLRTNLTWSKPFINLNDFTSIPFSFIFQLTYKARPWYIMILLANLWFDNIPFVFKSSIQIISWLLIISVLSLFKKSLRWFITSHIVVPLLFFVFDSFLTQKDQYFSLLLIRLLDNLRCSRLSFCAILLVNLLLSIFWPLDRIAKSLIPPFDPVLTNSDISSSQRSDTKYFALAFFLIVAFMIRPFGSWPLANFISPSLGNFMRLFLISILLLTFLVV